MVRFFAFVLAQISGKLTQEFQDLKLELLERL
jgi:hypothetical protein